MSAKNKSSSKSQISYWSSRLFKRGPDGKQIPNDSHGNWWVQISVAAKQSRIPLQTPNKDAAASLACKIYESLRANGWDATRASFPEIWPVRVEKINSPTVGDFLRIVSTHGGIKPITFTIYARKFRRLVAAIAKIKGDAARYHRGEGSQKWREAVEAVRLDALTPAAITRWRNEFRAIKRNPLAQERAETTVHSVLRNSRSLFAPTIRKALETAKVEIQWPAPMPFDGVDIGTAPERKYTDKLDIESIMKAANKELAKNDPEALKIFLLCCGVGLRRGEIDKMLWTQFLWHENQIKVEVTEYAGVKGKGSTALIDVDPALMKVFHKFMTKATGEFVIESSVEPQPGVTWYHYRCDLAFKRLNHWLRDKGVTAQKPLHHLRKEFGSRIAQQFGIYAAQTALRHKDIRLTVGTYANPRGRIHLEVGKMLTGGKSTP